MDGVIIFMLASCFLGIGCILFFGWYADRYGKKSNVVGYYNALTESEKTDESV